MEISRRKEKMLGFEDTIIEMKDDLGDDFNVMLSVEHDGPNVFLYVGEPYGARSVDFCFTSEDAKIFREIAEHLENA